MGHLRRPAQAHRRCPSRSPAPSSDPSSSPAAASIWACCSAGCRSSRASAAPRCAPSAAWARAASSAATLRASMKLPLRRCRQAHVRPRSRPSGAAGSTDAVGNDDFWEPLDHTHRIGARTPPTSFVSGWYDFMLDQLLRDYETLVDAGGTPHASRSARGFTSAKSCRCESIRDTLSWMNAELLGDRSVLHDKPVRLYISGRDEWHSFAAYPPGCARHPDLASPSGQRAVAAPGEGLARPTRYTYDPSEPDAQSRRRDVRLHRRRAGQSGQAGGTERRSRLHLRAALRRSHDHRQRDRA